MCTRMAASSAARAESTRAPTRSAGVVGTARRKGGSQLQGETRRGRGWRPQHRNRRWSRRESDGAIGALMPSNAGGAKGPDFWCAFEDGEVKVIGDEPDNA